MPGAVSLEHLHLTSVSTSFTAFHQDDVDSSTTVYHVQEEFNFQLQAGKKPTPGKHDQNNTGRSSFRCNTGRSSFRWLTTNFATSGGRSSGGGGSSSSTSSSGSYHKDHNPVQHHLKMIKHTSFAIHQESLQVLLHSVRTATGKAKNAKTRLGKTSFNPLWPGATFKDQQLYSAGQRNRSETSTGLLAGMNAWPAEKDDANRITSTAKHLEPGPESCEYVKATSNGLDTTAAGSPEGTANLTNDFVNKNGLNTLRAEAIKFEMKKSGSSCTPGNYRCCTNLKMQSRADPNLFREGQYVFIRSDSGEEDGDALMARVKRFEPVTQGWVVQPLRPRRGSLSPKDDLQTVNSVQVRCQRSAENPEGKKDLVDAGDYKSYWSGMEPIAVESKIPERCRGDEKTYKCELFDKECRVMPGTPSEAETLNAHGSDDEPERPPPLPPTMDQNSHIEMKDENFVSENTPGITCKQRLEACQYNYSFHASNQNETGWTPPLGYQPGMNREKPLGRAHDAKSRKLLLGEAIDEYMFHYPDPKGFLGNQLVERLKIGQMPGEGLVAHVSGFNNETGKYKIVPVGNPALDAENENSVIGKEIEAARNDPDTGEKLEPVDGVYVRCHRQDFGSFWDWADNNIPDDKGDYTAIYGANNQKATNSWWPAPIRKSDDLPAECNYRRGNDYYPMWMEFSNVPYELRNHHTIWKGKARDAGGNPGHWFPEERPGDQNGLGTGKWKLPMPGVDMPNWVWKTDKQRKDMNLNWKKLLVDAALVRVRHWYHKDREYVRDQHVSAEKYEGKILGTMDRKLPLEQWGDTEMYDLQHFRPGPQPELTIPARNLRAIEGGLRITCGDNSEWGDREGIVTSWRQVPEICKKNFKWKVQLWGNLDDDTSVAEKPANWNREQKEYRKFIESVLANQAMAWPAPQSNMLQVDAMSEFECSKKCCGNRFCKSFSYLKNKTRKNNCLLFKQLDAAVISTKATELRNTPCGKEVSHMQFCRQTEKYCSYFADPNVSPIFSKVDEASPLTTLSGENVKQAAAPKCQQCPDFKNGETCASMVQKQKEAGMFDVNISKRNGQSADIDEQARDMLISESSANCNINCQFDPRPWKTCKLDTVDATYEKDPLPVVYASVRLRPRIREWVPDDCCGGEWVWNWNQHGPWTDYQPIRDISDFAKSRFKFQGSEAEQSITIKGKDRDTKMRLGRSKPTEGFGSSWEKVPVSDEYPDGWRYRGKVGEMLFPRPSKNMAVDLQFMVKNSDGHKTTVKNIVVPGRNEKLQQRFLPFFPTDYFKKVQDIGGVRKVIQKAWRMKNEINPDRGIFRNAIVEFVNRKKAKVLYWDPVHEEAVLQDLATSRVFYQQRPEVHFHAPRAKDNYTCHEGIRVQTRLHEIKTVTAPSQEECAVQCDKQTNCESFDFFKGEEKWRTSKQMNCHLYSKNGHTKELLLRDRQGLRKEKIHFGRRKADINMDLEKVLPNYKQSKHSNEYSRMGIPFLEAPLKPDKEQEKTFIFQIPCEACINSWARHGMAVTETKDFNQDLDPDSAGDFSKSVHMGTGATRGLNGARDRLWCRNGNGALVNNRCSVQELGHARRNRQAKWYTKGTLDYEEQDEKGRMVRKEAKVIDRVPDEGMYTEPAVEAKDGRHMVQDHITPYRKYLWGYGRVEMGLNEDAPEYWHHCDRKKPHTGIINRNSSSAVINNSMMQEICRPAWERPGVANGVDMCHSRCVFELQGNGKETSLVDGSKNEKPGGIDQDISCRKMCLDHAITPYNPRWDDLDENMKAVLMKDQYVESPEGTNTGRNSNPGAIKLRPYLNKKCNAIYDFFCRKDAPGRSHWEKGNPPPHPKDKDKPPSKWHHGRWPFTHDSYECMDLHDPIRDEPNPIDPSCCGGWAEPFSNNHGRYSSWSPFPKIFCNQFYRTDMAFGKRFGQELGAIDKEHDPVETPNVPEGELKAVDPVTGDTTTFSGFNKHRQRGHCEVPERGKPMDIIYPWEDHHGDTVGKRNKRYTMDPESCLQMGHSVFKEMEDAYYDFARLQSGHQGSGRMFAWDAVDKRAYHGGIRDVRGMRWHENNTKVTMEQCRMPVVMVTKHMGDQEASSFDVSPMKPACRVHIASKDFEDKDPNDTDTYLQQSEALGALHDETNNGTEGVEGIPEDGADLPEGVSV
ncbi:unnamed protein product [Amoebophrya sp. A120]|nr:unnamed protein product [Amoebophrya sp. A120]|eukprot:GSA120T00013671001.1